MSKEAVAFILQKAEIKSIEDFKAEGRMKTVDNAQTRVASVDKNSPEAISAFLSLGRDYLKGLPVEEQEKFLQSILARQGELNRWLLLLKHRNEYVGFVHMKIDKDERIGWGFILEFYIVPSKRRSGFGCKFFNLVTCMLEAEGVKNIWLLTNSSAEPFWNSLGFRLSGEIDKETGQNIMIKSLEKESETTI